MDELELEVSRLKDDNENLKIAVSRMQTNLDKVLTMLQESGNFNESEEKIIDDVLTDMAAHHIDF